MHHKFPPSLYQNKQKKILLLSQKTNPLHKSIKKFPFTYITETQEAKTKTGKDSKPASRKQSLKDKDKEDEKTDSKPASRKASLKDKTDEEKPESKPSSRKPSLSEEKAKKAEVKLLFYEQIQQTHNNLIAVTRNKRFVTVKTCIIELIVTIK